MRCLSPTSRVKRLYASDLSHHPCFGLGDIGTQQIRHRALSEPQPVQAVYNNCQHRPIYLVYTTRDYRSASIGTLLQALAPKALWSALWPVLIGGVMAFGLSRWEGWLPRVPPGDIVVAGEPAVGAILRWEERIEEAEAYLRQWPVASPDEPRDHLDRRGDDWGLNAREIS